MLSPDDKMNWICDKGFVSFLILSCDIFGGCGLGLDSGYLQTRIDYIDNCGGENMC